MDSPYLPSVKMDFHPKTVVVTGASTGIGHTCALHLDQADWLVFAGVRKAADAKALRQVASTRLTPVIIDVTDTNSIATAVTIVENTVGSIGLSGLVNNAGIAVGGPLEFLSLERLRAQLEINVIGQIAVTQAFLPLLRQRQGRIVNMSSLSGRLAIPFIGPYSASKFALEALTDALRGELRPWGIHVVSVEPGSIATPIWTKALSLSSEIAAELPDQAHSLYGQLLEELMRTVEASGRRGIPTEVVARVVERALTSRRPKTRYLVGVDAHVGALMSRFLPDRLRDWLIFNFYRHS